MIESLATSHAAQTGKTQRVLTYVKNERMGGYVPKYETIKASDIQISNNIEQSLAGAQGHDTLSYQSTKQVLDDNEQFGFMDLVDMVNPLQHVPVINHVYRELTGDQIKPISRIVGGAAFSGPIGVASALIDTVVEKETGHTLSGNAFNIALGRSPAPVASETQIAKAKTPEAAIENAINATDDYAMTSALLTYSNLGAKDKSILKYEAAKRVEEVMEKSSAPREPISQVSFSQKGGLYAL